MNFGLQMISPRFASDGGAEIKFVVSGIIMCWVFIQVARMLFGLSLWLFLTFCPSIRLRCLIRPIFKHFIQILWSLIAWRLRAKIICFYCQGFWRWIQTIHLYWISFYSDMKSCLYLLLIFSLICSPKLLVSLLFSSPSLFLFPSLLIFLFTSLFISTFLFIFIFTFPFIFTSASASAFTFLFVSLLSQSLIEECYRELRDILLWEVAK